MPGRMSFGLRWQMRLVARHRGRQWRTLARVVAVGLGLACSAPAPATTPAAPDAAQLGALDCAAVSAGDVREVLSRHPAPRVIAQASDIERLDRAIDA